MIGKEKRSGWIWLVVVIVVFVAAVFIIQTFRIDIHLSPDFNCEYPDTGEENPDEITGRAVITGFPSCEACKGLNARCSPRCCSGLSCDFSQGGVCKKNIGKSCRPGRSDCFGGLVCDSTSTCRVWEGGSCSRGRDCAEGLICCAVGGGQSCISSHACESLHGEETEY